MKFAFSVWVILYTMQFRGYCETIRKSSTACVEEFFNDMTCSLDASSWPRPDCKNENVFYECSIDNRTSTGEATGKVIRYRCKRNGKKVSFYDPHSRKCMFGKVHQRFKRQSGQVGSACFFNTDCLSGMYCNAGRCICLSTYIQRDNFCYEKINPGQSGCIYDEQCSGVWARATCTNSICTCPSVQGLLSGSLIPVQTKDGIVCAADTYCPLPIDDGLITVLEPSVAVCTSTTDCAKTPTLTAPGAETISELYECSAISACCPNRAYTCSLPMGSSPSSGTGWWFNSATGACQQITPTNNTINSNNFATQEHCHSYCGSICPRGNPQYVDGKPVSCSGGVGCESNYLCATIGSLQRCCPKPNFVCSRNGGLSAAPTSQTTEYNEGFVKSSLIKQETTTRYYYDSQSRQCLSFTYLGSGGNFNNFLTHAACQSYCVQQVLCSKGNPLMDSSGQSQKCSPVSSCPMTHTCHNGVCCPTKQTICAQVQQLGTCTQFSQRYWYNSVSKQCESFTYSGCQGNDNNFLTILECQSFCKTTTAEPQCTQGKALRDSNGNFMTCAQSSMTNRCPPNYECHFDGSHFGCCPVKTFTCSLTSNSGVSCGPSSVRWSFDTRLQTCTSFTYLGCDGNSNNFPSKEQCESYCGVGACASGGEPLLDSSTGRIRLCSSTAACPSTHECTLFSSASTTPVSYCCPSRAFTCSQSPDAGQACPGGGTNPHSSTSTRYYYNSNTKTCSTMVYNGCGGNGNNFLNMQQCETFCHSAACSNGQSVYSNPGSQNPLICNTVVASSCPTGYTCQHDNMNQRSVCCGSSDLGVCPNGERAYIEPLSGDPKTCVPSLANSCSSGYLCRFSTLRNRYYCCASLTSNQCPSGHAPYLTPNDNQPVICPIGAPGTVCPVGYRCQTPVAGGYHGYCCTDNPLCPIGYTVLQTSKGAHACTVGALNYCPTMYQCLASNLNSTSGYCCTNTVGKSKSVCSAEGIPYLLNNAPIICDPSSKSCPPSYQCQLHVESNTYYCCSSGKTEVCSSGSVYKMNGVPMACSGSTGSTCPIGYFCSPSTIAIGLSYCCSSSPIAVCGSATPYEAGGSSVTCDPGDNRCPPNYRCNFYAPGNTYYCCKEETVICPNGGTLTTRNCSPNVSDSCPVGATCQLIVENERYQCCNGTAVIDFGHCVNNRPAFIEPMTGLVKSCGSSETACPDGYACQYSTSNAAICCKVDSEVAPPACPDGSRLHLTSNNEPQPCRIGHRDTPCPSGTRCLKTSNGLPYCCSRIIEGAECSGDRSAYRNQKTGIVQKCYGIGLDDTCPIGYTCEKQNGPGKSFVCCPTRGADKGRVCMNGGRQFLYPATQYPLACSPVRSQCPIGFVCSPTMNGDQYFCCSIRSAVTGFAYSIDASGCPPGSEPLQTSNDVYDSNENGECSFDGPPACPPSYQCVYSQLKERYQCCSILGNALDSFNDKRRWFRRQMCLVKRCRLGEYGCFANTDCATPSNNCVDGRCVCPFGSFISPRENCVIECPPYHHVINGECVYRRFQNPLLQRILKNDWYFREDLPYQVQKRSSVNETCRG